MSRQVESKGDTVENMAPLLPSINHASRLPMSNASHKLHKNNRPQDQSSQLNPYTVPLGMQDIDACDVLEQAAFEPGNRASRDKFIYRIHKCSGLCYGLFTTAEPGSEHVNAATYLSAPKVETGSDRKRVLLGHIIATQTNNLAIKDEDMALPPDWDRYPLYNRTKFGHKEFGRTICIHSLAVLPQYHGKGIGTCLMKGYIQRMKDAKIADRIALLAEDKLVPFYEALGFRNIGKSESTFGDVAWNDMIFDFAALASD